MAAIEGKALDDAAHSRGSRALVPPLPAVHLARPALSDALDDAARSRLTVVSGGPGWGKTTAVAAWAAGRTAAWLTLEPGDASPRELAAGILEALRHRVPGLPQTLAADQSLPDVLTARLDRRLILVLDGLHELPPAGDAIQLVHGLVEHGPAGLHLVLLTQLASAGRLPPAPRLEPVCEIGPGRLAFTETEVAAFLEALLGAPDPVAAGEVWALTSGWPAAVHLAAETVRAAGVEGRLALPRLRTSGTRLLDALATRVVEAEPEPARRLLTTAAILGTVDAPLCEALGHRDAAAILPVLAQHGLLSREGSEESSWSVLRPVRDLLTRGAEAGSPRANEAHTRAAAHRIARSEYAAALRHLVAAGDREAAERLLVEHGHRMLSEGEVAAVLFAADSLELRGPDPSLLVVLGYARQLHGDWLGALEYLRAAAGTGVLEPAMARRLGHLCYVTGRPDEAIDAFRRVRIADDGADTEEIQLLCEAAIWLRAVGEDGEARQTGARAAVLAERRGDPATSAHAHRVLALLAAHDGDRAAHDMHFRRALRLAQSLGDHLLRLALLINRASYLVEEGSPAETLEAVEAALSLGRESGFLGYEPFCYSIRGRANARLARFDDAGADVDTAQQRWQNIGPSLDIAFGLMVRGDIHRRRGEPSQAQAALEEGLRSLTDSIASRPLRALILPILARVRAVEDLAAARDLAEQAVDVATGTGKVPALLARGWIALLAGENETASRDAAECRATAGTRRDRAGLAEALELAVLSAPEPKAMLGLLDEAETLYRDLADPIGLARVRLIAARLAGPPGHIAADAAVAELRGYGLQIDSGIADALAVPVSRPLITVQTLGAFRVLRADAPVPAGEWRSKKARDLFKILVAHRGWPVPRERLMDLLWPDEPRSRTANRLSVLLSTLRTVLDPARAFPEPGPIAADRDAVAIDLDSISIDSERFLAAAADAQAAQRRGDPRAPALLAAAETAYTGDFLPENLYDEWAQAMREAARTAHIAVLRALIRVSTDPELREQCLHRLLAHDPYDEQTHRELVGLLHAAGRRGEALRRYDIYAKRMAELGVIPAGAPPA